jgi:hypothetical protein
LRIADAVPEAEGNIEHAVVAGRAEPPGSDENRARTRRSPRNLGDLVVSTPRSGNGHPVNKPRLADAALGIHESE